MAYSDPYETWKEQGKPGGSFDAWKSSQGGGAAAPAPAPAAPTGFPPPPSPSSSGAAPAPAPGGGAPSPDPNDPKAFQAWYIAQQGGNRPEDMERFLQPDTLKRWDPYLIKEGPDAGKYRSMRGAPGVFDKPTECPPGMSPGGPDEDSPCVGGGGGGAGGGGGSAGAPGTQAGGGAGGDLASMMEQVLKTSLSGEGSRYNPKAMQGLLAAIKQNVESQRKTQVRQAGESAAARGMSRSGYAGVNEAKINAAAGQSFTGAYSDVLKAKIDADYQDKMGALDRSQKYLDSLRDEMYRRDMSAIQQQQFKANLDLAYANIRAQRDALNSSQQHAKDMLGAQYGYSATFGGL